MYGTPLFDLVVALYTLLWQILFQTKTNSTIRSDWRASRVLCACFKFLSQTEKIMFCAFVTDICSRRHTSKE